MLAYLCPGPTRDKSETELRDWFAVLSFFALFQWSSYISESSFITILSTSNTQHYGEEEAAVATGTRSELRDP